MRSYLLPAYFNPAGVNFPTGIAAGAFNPVPYTNVEENNKNLRTPNFASSGVNVGSSFAYNTSFRQPTDYLVQTISSAAPVFIALGGANQVGFVKQQINADTIGMKLDTPRQLEAAIVNVSLADFTAIFYGIDRYGQLFVSAPETVTAGTDAVSRCNVGVDYLVAVLITPVNYTDPFNITIRSTRFLELPYSDYGLCGTCYALVAHEEINLATITPVTAEQNIFALNQSAADAGAIRYLPATYVNLVDSNGELNENPLRLATGRPRPFLRLNEQITTAPSVNLTVIQEVFGIGAGLSFLDPSLPQINPQAPLGTIIGYKPYSTGWVNWKG